MNCPKCNSSLEGELIYDIMLKKKHGNKIEAEEVAKMQYGATKTTGRWDRRIALIHRDRVSQWQCPDCGHIWERG